MLELAKEQVHARSRSWNPERDMASAGPTGQQAGDAVAAIAGIRGTDAGWGNIPDDAGVRHWTVHSGLMLTWREGVPAIIAQTAERRAHLMLKRAFDVLMGAAALLALLPLMIAIGLAIRLSSPGPVFFGQIREGFLGQPITVLKFRTMYVDRCDWSGVAQTVADDPRITPIGKILRRTSLDELPQLFNVLSGEMSLIGPRPHAPGMLAGGVPYDQLVGYYHRRELMKPGLSGWAQANGLRGPTDDADKARARVDHDLAYIENFSFWLDLKIVWMTLRHEFLKGSGL